MSKGKTILSQAKQNKKKKYSAIFFSYFMSDGHIF